MHEHHRRLVVVVVVEEAEEKPPQTYRSSTIASITEACTNGPLKAEFTRKFSAKEGTCA